MWQRVQTQSSHILEELAHVEWARLRTFSRFQFTMNVSSIRLARAGFFLSGNNVITCYSCGITRSSWNEKEDPDIYHQNVSPDCSHVTGSHSANIPIPRPPGVTLPEVTAKNPPLRDNNSSSNQPMRGNNASNNQTLRENNSSNNQPLRENNSSNNQPLRENNSSNNQPSNNLSLGEPDHVRSRSDDSPQEHNRPTSRSNNLAQKPDRTASRSDDSAQETYYSSSLDFDTPNVTYSKPKYPEFALLNSREASYNSWPRHLYQTKEQMAEAGFIYSGHSDCTRCFFCGGGLRNWMPGDDPWTEHARWFPQCTFLLQNKGGDFVRNIRQSNSESLGIESEVSSRDGGKPKPPTDMWSYAAVQSLLDMGYNRGMVEQATSNVKRGLQDVEAAELLDEVFRIQDGKESGVMSDPGEKQSVTKSLDCGDKETCLLMEENQRLREMSVCKVCGDGEVKIVFLPCGHFVCCSECAPAMVKCPVCKVTIQASVRAWLV
ncbi:baculoviral IAP repeat-containing protein 7-like isoform X2 [Argopecten irradians]|uniref:baculoviral IAP repeat-containing protein 7-like isoform X2 n=1 Tax=Argopecten irradians TaxID=31199 RepID=UPI0037155D79